MRSVMEAEMNLAQSQRFRNLLEREYDRARTLVARPLPTAMTSPQADALDCAADLSLWTIAQATHLAARRRLAQAEMALARFEAGTYGICQECSKPIDPARLEIVPAALLCVDCQRKAEKAHS
jgi:RNA polymerase-binding transcription factor DksA